VLSFAKEAVWNGRAANEGHPRIEIALASLLE